MQKRRRRDRRQHQAETARAIIASGRYVTPQDFGAKGDGVTDDATAVQRALRAISAATRGEAWNEMRPGVPRSPPR